MADGTVLNGVFAARLHKAHIDSFIENAEECVSDIEKRLLVLIAMTPTVELCDELPTIVAELMESLQCINVKLFCANYVKDNPKECEDDYENRDDI